MSVLTLRPIRPIDVAIPPAGYKSTFLNVEDGGKLYQKDEFGVVKKILEDVNLYTHNQTSASAVWTIYHNTDTYPSVTVVDSAGTRVYGDEVFLSSNVVQITFSAPFSGKAYLMCDVQ